MHICSVSRQSSSGPPRTTPRHATRREVRLHALTPCSESGYGRLLMPRSKPTAAPEVVILVGLPAAGKTSFYRDRFAATHVHISKDLLRNRGERQQRQLELIDTALAEGRSVVVDNVNATRADRAALIAAARRHGTAVIGYVFEEISRHC